MTIMTVGNARARERVLATPHDIYAYSCHDLRDNSAFRSDVDTGQNRRPGALKGIARGS